VHFWRRSKRIQRQHILHSDIHVPAERSSAPKQGLEAEVRLETCDVYTLRVRKESYFRTRQAALGLMMLLAAVI
jgi:hypothetical protein